MKDSVPTDTYRSKVLGSLLGGAIGDALGAPVEFWSRDQITATVGEQGVREFLPITFGGTGGIGLITDDTQMTLFTMEGLISAYNRGRAKGIGFAMPLVHQAYLRWYRTQVTSSPPSSAAGLASEAWLYSQRAPGMTCLAALQAVAADPDPWPALLGSVATNDSKGCGTVMRAAPFGWIPCDRGDLAHWIIPSALEVAGYTHGHVTGQVSAAALAVLIYEVMAEADLLTATRASITAIGNVLGADETVTALTHALDAATHRPGDPTVLAALGEGWTAEEALAIAVYSALSHPGPEDVLNALSLAVSHTGDSDSTGAICGNILGALHGVDSLPGNLLQQLEGASSIHRIGEEYIRTLIPLHEATYHERRTT